MIYDGGNGWYDQRGKSGDGWIDGRGERKAAKKKRKTGDWTKNIEEEYYY